VHTRISSITLSVIWLVIPLHTSLTMMYLLWIYSYSVVLLILLLILRHIHISLLLIIRIVIVWVYVLGRRWIVLVGLLLLRVRINFLIIAHLCLHPFIAHWLYIVCI